MLKIITGQPELIAVKMVYDAHRRMFEHYASARDSFEHYHDRLPGQNDAGKVRAIQPDPNAGPRQVFFGFSGGSYKHSDKSWDITPGSLALLNDALDPIIAVLHKTIDDRITALSGQSSQDVPPPAT